MRPNNAWLKEHFRISEIGDREARVFCTMHQDGARASLYINLESGKWKCHGGCGAGALSTLCKRLNIGRPVASEEDEVQAVEKRDKPQKYVPMEHVDAAQKLFWTKAGDGARKYLLGRGISPAVLKRFRVGLDPRPDERLRRVWFPVFDFDGQCINVRCYDWSKTHRDKYIPYAKGYGEARLWPAGVVAANEEVILFEGESDCLLALSLGLDGAITATGGASKWDPSFTRALAGKDVLICYDIDQAGREGAAAVHRLLSVTSKPLVVHLPISEPKNGDFTDYVRAVENDRRAVHKLFGDARAGRSAGPATKASFAQLATLDPTGKDLRSLRAVVSGKDLTPFNVPAAVRISCVPSAKAPACAGCPLLAGGGTVDVTIPITSKVVLKSVLSTDQTVEFAVRDHCRIPARCPGHQQEITKTQPLWDLRLSPDVDSTEEEGSEGSRRAFSMTDLATNQPYDLTMVASSDPKTQYSLLHILEAKSSLTSLDAWTKDGKEKLLQLWEV